MKLHLLKLYRQMCLGLLSFFPGLDWLFSADLWQSSLCTSNTSNGKSCNYNICYRNVISQHLFDITSLGVSYFLLT